MSVKPTPAPPPVSGPETNGQFNYINLLLVMLNVIRFLLSYYPQAKKVWLKWRHR